MSKRKVNPEVAKLAESLSIDTLIYQLTEYAWFKRDEESELETKNPAEERYWQKVGEILSDLGEKLELI